MPKQLHVVIEVPSHSRASSMLVWLNKILAEHRMKAHTVIDPDARRTPDPLDLAPKFSLGDTIKSAVSSTLYTIMFTPTHATLEKTIEGCYGYIQQGTDNATLWIRSQREVEDGRFELVQ